MTDFLNSLKADLLDRRLVPLVALVAVGLLGGLGYALLGGSSGTSSPTVAAAPISTPAGSGGLTVAQTQPSANQAVAETTTGAGVQRHGTSRNPFSPLAGASTAASTASGAKALVPLSGSASKTVSSSTTSSSTTSTTTTTGSSTPSASTPSTPKPAAPAKPKTLYSVAVEFGQLPAVLPLPPGFELKSFVALTKATPLPSAKARQLEFLGVTVTRTGKSATFAIDSELIPTAGSAACLPSKVQCNMIDLGVGKSEQLLGTLPNGETATYELRVVSIAAAKASTASVSSVLRAQRRVSRELLGRGGLMELSGLHYSSRAGVLVFGGSAAFGARAHVARQHSRHGG